LCMPACTAGFTLNTSEEKDVVSPDLFCYSFDGWFLLGLGKATHTSSPFFIRTALVDVTLVF